MLQEKKRGKRNLKRCLNGRCDERTVEVSMRGELLILSIMDREKGEMNVERVKKKERERGEREKGRAKEDLKEDEREEESEKTIEREMREGKRKKERVG